MRTARNGQYKIIDFDNALNENCFCRFCDRPLIKRNGSLREGHFAHRPNESCFDTWNKSESNYYDMSAWHNSWQEAFPLENREILIKNSGIVHRADVLCANIIIEFQHSSISSKTFNDRNNFYAGFGYRVVWLFDCIDEFKERIINIERNNLTWTNIRPCLDHINYRNSNIDIFIQISNDEIYKLLGKNRKSKTVQVSKYSKVEFLSYCGEHNGRYPKPTVFDDNNFDEFVKKYNLVNLNNQQLRAVQSAFGSTLVLAVPGSGKTTVLINHIAYLILFKGIKPENILATTFTVNAAKEIKIRLYNRFKLPKDTIDKIKVCTLNSLGYEVTHSVQQTMITADESESKKYIIEALKENKLSYDLNNIEDYFQEISYIKSFLDRKYRINTSKFKMIKEVYDSYNRILKENGKIDFKDQLYEAVQILKKYDGILKQYKLRYKYICVDEAQDNSEVMFELIKLINDCNVFFVGDEDQSIYGFNGAFPGYLLDFRNNFKNACLLKLSTNYRCTPEIVEKANLLIKNNKQRIDKHMSTTNPNGKNVELVRTDNCFNETKKILEIIKSSDKRIAILYRENINRLPVINALNNSDITYNILNNIKDEFRRKPLKELMAFFKLMDNLGDFQSFKIICPVLSGQNHGKDIYCYIAKKYTNNPDDNVFEITRKLVKKKCYTKKKSFILRRLDEIEDLLSECKKSKAQDIIEMLLDEIVYNDQIREKYIDILNRMFDGSVGYKEMYKQLSTLQNSITNKNEDARVILSTIHSAKGLEFDRVILIDIFDGCCPGGTFDEYGNLVRAADVEEERRLVYVGMTRAIKELYFIKNDNIGSKYIDEVFDHS